MATLVDSDTYLLGPRTVLIPGDHFRVSGGPVYRGQSIALRGEFVFLRAFQRGSRIFVEGAKVSPWGIGARYTLLVAGPPFPSRQFPGVKNVPYRLRAVRRAKRRSLAR